MQSKQAFTLIEILVILVVIGLLLVMIPFRLQWLHAHTQLSLVAQTREDWWQRTLLRMRQWRMADVATVQLGTTWTVVVFSGWIEWDKVEFIPFEETVVLTPNIWLVWNIASYTISCMDWYASWFSLSFEWMRVCYKVDLSSCNIYRVLCNSQ